MLSKLQGLLENKYIKPLTNFFAFEEEIENLLLGFWEKASLTEVSKIALKWVMETMPERIASFSDFIFNYLNYMANCYLQPIDDFPINEDLRSFATVPSASFALTSYLTEKQPEWQAKGGSYLTASDVVEVCKGSIPSIDKLSKLGSARMMSCVPFHLCYPFILEEDRTVPYPYPACAAAAPFTLKILPVVNDIMKLLKDSLHNEMSRETYSRLVFAGALYDYFRIRKQSEHMSMLESVGKDMADRGGEELGDAVFAGVAPFCKTLTVDASRQDLEKIFGDCHGDAHTKAGCFRWCLLDFACLLMTYSVAPPYSYACRSVAGGLVPSAGPSFTPGGVGLIDGCGSIIAGTLQHADEVQCLGLQQGVGVDLWEPGSGGRFDLGSAFLQEWEEDGEDSSSLIQLQKIKRREDSEAKEDCDAKVDTLPDQKKGRLKDIWLKRLTMSEKMFFMTAGGFVSVTSTQEAMIRADATAQALKVSVEAGARTAYANQYNLVMGATWFSRVITMVQDPGRMPTMIRCILALFGKMVRNSEGKFEAVARLKKGAKVRLKEEAREEEVADVIQAREPYIVMMRNITREPQPDFASNLAEYRKQQDKLYPRASYLRHSHRLSKAVESPACAKNHDRPALALRQGFMAPEILEMQTKNASDFILLTTELGRLVMYDKKIWTVARDPDLDSRSRQVGSFSEEAAGPPSEIFLVHGRERSSTVASVEQGYKAPAGGAAISPGTATPADELRPDPDAWGAAVELPPGSSDDDDGHDVLHDQSRVISSVADMMEQVGPVFGVKDVEELME